MTAESEQRLGADHLVEGAAALAEGERLLTKVDGRDIGIFRIHGELRAWENRCPHQRGPVCTGLLVGRTELVLGENQTVVREERSPDVIHIACPWHGWEFDIDSGICWALPSARLRAVKIYEQDGNVYVRHHERAADHG